MMQTATRSPRAKWVVAISLIFAGIAGLAAWAFVSPGALAYYATPSQVAEQGSSAMTKTLRVGGRVEAGSLHRSGSTVRFVITDGREQVPVLYRGEVPDTLKEGTDAIAEGHLSSDGTLRASRVQAKCSSKFVPKDRPQDLGK
jgi:cytochrome c-type biogenesis protein CcmE